MDRNGNLLSYTDTVMGTWNFSHDHLNRLASAIPGTGAPSSYSGEKLCMAYDSFGDRTQSNFQTTACSSVEMPFTSESCLVKKKSTRPQRISSSSRSPVSRALRITGWKVVGATL
jgi:hypothetical protein